MATVPDPGRTENAYKSRTEYIRRLRYKLPIRTMVGEETWSEDQMRDRDGVVLQQRVRLLRGVPAMRDLPADQLERIALEARLLSFAPGRVVVAEGDTAHSFYVVVSGNAEVVQRGGNESEERLCRIEAGGSFGELGLLQDAPRAASVVVCGDVPLEVLVIPGGLFREFVAPALAGVAGAALGAGSLLDLSESGSSSSGPPGGFALAIGLDVASVQSVRGRYRDVDTGTVLVRSGAPAERFYVVVSGVLEVVRNGRTVAELGPGEFCGETGLLLGIPRTATVRAGRRARVWVVDRSEFERSVAHRLLADRRTSQVVLRRIASLHQKAA